MRSHTLEELIEWARGYKMSPAEQRAQIRSFEIDQFSLDHPEMPREEVERLVDTALEHYSQRTLPMPNLTLPIVGARFRPPADDILRLLPSGIALLLRAQPENPYDANAIAVFLPLEDPRLEAPKNLILASGGELEGPFHLGFIPAKDAAHITLEGDTPATLAFSLAGGPMVSFTDPTPPEVL